jgi:hypothetical protein
MPSEEGQDSWWAVVPIHLSVANFLSHLAIFQKISEASFELHIKEAQYWTEQTKIKFVS